MPLIGVPAEVQLKRLQPLATPAVVKPEAIIVAPGDRTGPAVGETATDGEAEALTDEPGVADTLGAGGMEQPELAPGELRPGLAPFVHGPIT